jgi:hypothetical protein
MAADSIGRSKEGNPAGVLRRKVALTGGPTVSVTREEDRRQRVRELGQRCSLGSAQAGRGEAGDGPRARRQTGHGEGGLPTELGRKLGREMKLLFFFLFKYFKVFSNYFESSFEFKSNHSIQNIQMQQHECTNMFLPLYLILS